MSNTKDYIIFDKAPKIVFTCNESISDWYKATTETSEKTRITGTITTDDCAEQFVLQDIPADIKIRGNYTANYNKKPFQIRFTEKQNLFGLNNGNAHKKWVLLAEYNDSSFLRNALSFYIAKKLLADTSIWVPTFTLAHFYIQDTENLYYMGLFVLCDQKEQDEFRVNVFKPEDEYAGTDIGYFFEKDDYAIREVDDPTFFLYDADYNPTAPIKTDHESNRWARQVGGQQVNYDGFTIKSKITNENQVSYLKTRLIKLYEILYRAVNNEGYYELDVNNNLIPSAFNDPIDVIKRSFDLNSFVDMYILHEIVCNPDIAHSSFHFSLDMSPTGNKKLTLCAPWDFDLSLGVSKNFAVNPTTANLWAKQCTLNPWISLLTGLEGFKDLVKARWEALYNTLQQDSIALLNDYSTQYSSDFAQNFQEWPFNWVYNATWNIPSAPTPEQFVQTKYRDAQSQKQCVEYFKTWFNDRLYILNELITQEPVPPSPPTPPAPSPDYDRIKHHRDYTIFDNAPTIIFNFDESLYPFNTWYTATAQGTGSPEVPGSITTKDCEQKYILNKVEVSYVRTRGNYTLNYRKKSLKIKFSEKQNLFGLNKTGKAKDWILLAEYGDNAMLRNALAFYIGQKILRKDWSPTFTFAHVYANEEYLGLYLICDQKEVGKNRVDINKPADGYEGVDIGYFFERDDYWRPDTATDPGFTMLYRDPSDYQPEKLPIIEHETNYYWGVGCPSRYREGYTIHNKIYSDYQIEFLKKYMCLIYTIIYQACINDIYLEINSTNINDWRKWTLVPSNAASAKDVISKVVDIDSFADMYILNEIAGNPDLAHSSFYFCLDASSSGNRKLRLTCPWDWDRAFGLCDGLSNPTRETLWAKDAHYNPWIALLPQTSWFTDLLEKRWQELYDNYFMRKCLDMLYDYSYSYYLEFEKNFEKYSIKWADDYGSRDPRRAASINPYYYENVQNEMDCEKLLSTWIDNRFKSIHSVLPGKGSTDWPKEPDPVPPVPPKPEDINIWKKAGSEHRYELRGLSTDTKPTKNTWTNLGDGSVLIEMDTSKLFIYDRENDVWYELTLQ